MNQEEFYDCFPLSREQVKEGIAVIGTEALKQLTLFLLVHEDDKRKAAQSDTQYVKDLTKHAFDILVEEMKKDLEHVDKEQDKFVERLGI